MTTIVLNFNENGESAEVNIAPLLADAQAALRLDGADEGETRDALVRLVEALTEGTVR